MCEPHGEHMALFGSLRSVVVGHVREWSFGELKKHAHKSTRLQACIVTLHTYPVYIVDHNGSGRASDS